MSENNGSENSRVIKTRDENGNVHSFELIDVLELDGREYGLLAYLEENGSSDEEEEVVIMKLKKNDEAYTFETIEDDEEFNKIVAYLESESEED